jgi:hypothetical protein
MGFLAFRTLSGNGACAWLSFLLLAHYSGSPETSSKPADSLESASGAKDRGAELDGGGAEPKGAPSTSDGQEGKNFISGRIICAIIATCSSEG